MNLIADKGQNKRKNAFFFETVRLFDIKHLNNSHVETKNRCENAL